MVYHSTNFDFSNKPSVVPSLWDVMVTPLNSWDEVFTTKKKFIIGLCRHWFAILFRKKKIVNTSWSDKVEISNILKLSPINIITNIPHVYENRRRGALGVICANTTKSLLGGAVSPILGELGWKKTPSLYHNPNQSICPYKIGKKTIIFGVSMCMWWFFTLLSCCSSSRRDHSQDLLVSMQHRLPRTCHKVCVYIYTCVHIVSNMTSEFWFLTLKTYIS